MVPQKNFATWTSGRGGREGAPRDKKKKKKNFGANKQTDKTLVKKKKKKFFAIACLFFLRASRSRSSQFKRTCKSLIPYATHSHQMPVGNLRTAANNDQDDDPRALRPIPIATKDMVSFVEKNNTRGGAKRGSGTFHVF